jgi:hypothetical protein
MMKILLLVIISMIKIEANTSDFVILRDHTKICVFDTRCNEFYDEFEISLSKTGNKWTNIEIRDIDLNSSKLFFTISYVERVDIKKNDIYVLDKYDYDITSKILQLESRYIYKIKDREKINDYNGEIRKRKSLTFGKLYSYSASGNIVTDEVFDTLVNRIWPPKWCISNLIDDTQYIAKGHLFVLKAGKKELFLLHSDIENEINNLKFIKGYSHPSLNSEGDKLIFTDYTHSIIEMDVSSKKIIQEIKVQESYNKQVHTLEFSSLGNYYLFSSRNEENYIQFDVYDKATKKIIPVPGKYDQGNWIKAK